MVDSYGVWQGSQHPRVDPGLLGHCLLEEGLLVGGLKVQGLSFSCIMNVHVGGGFRAEGQGEEISLRSGR